MTLKVATRLTAALFGAALALQPILTQAQLPDPWLGLVGEVEHTEGELAGQTTFRLYLYTANSDDFLVSCSGDDENPLYLTSTTEPAWFQHELATTAFATDINPAFFSTFPEFAYDSWLTIGAEDNTAAADVISLADPEYDAFAAFEAGQNVAVTTTVGNAWFVLPIASNVEAISGDDYRVLVAQFTTAGEVSGQIQCQVFLDGDNQNEFRQVLPILVACNDPEALNYEPLSYSADGCEYAEVDRISNLVTTHRIEAYPSPAMDGTTVTFPAHFASSLAGAELRATALDGRLVQSWSIEGVTQHLDVTDLAAGQYVLTVAGVSDATLRFRGDLVVVK
jgi:hypothetical protein